MARRPRTESLKNIAANMKAAPRVASGVAGDGSHVRIRKKMHPKSTLNFPERNVVLDEKYKTWNIIFGSDIEQEFGGVGRRGTPVSA